MRHLEGRPWRQGNTEYALIGVIAVLTAVFVLLAVGRRISQPREEETDAARMTELQAAKLVSTPGAASTATDWPRWRGPGRDGVSTQPGLLTAWPASGPPRLWEQPAGKGFSSLAVAEGRVFTLVQDGDHEAVVAWDADTGKELWRFRYPAFFQENFGDGPRSTPTIDGDRVYTVGGTGLLHCLKTHPKDDKGEVLWRKNLQEEFQAPVPRWGIVFSPLVEGDLLFTSPGGPNGNSLAAFDKLTGELRWKNLDDQSGYSSPVAATLAGRRQVIYFTAAGLVALEPATGKELWRFPWVTSFDCNVATPIVSGEYVFISSGYDHGCTVVKVEADAEGKLQAQGVYRNTKMRNHFNSCVLYQDHLYGFNEDWLTCMDFRTGKVKWKERGFNKGSLMVADGHLVILGENGKLALAEATPEAFQEKSAFQWGGERCWTVPALANGRLYLRDEQKVTCLDLRGK